MEGEGSKLSHIDIQREGSRWKGKGVSYHILTFRGKGAGGRGGSKLSHIDIQREGSRWKGRE